MKASEPRETQKELPEPNARRAADGFDNAYIINQVRSLAIVEAAKLLKVNYPIRITFHQIWESLGHLQDPIDNIFHGHHDLLLISCILRSQSLPHNSYKVGRTTVFFKADLIELRR